MNQTKTTDNDFWYGRNAPLHWIAVTLVMVIFISIISAIATEDYDREQAEACKRWVGSNYVYHDSVCYRIIDGTPHYVDIEFEKAIRRTQDQ